MSYGSSNSTWQETRTDHVKGSGVGPECKLPAVSIVVVAPLVLACCRGAAPGSVVTGVAVSLEQLLSGSVE